MSDQNPPRDDQQGPEHPQADPGPPPDFQPPGAEPEPSQPIGAEPHTWPQPEAPAAPQPADHGAWSESTGPAPAGTGEWSRPQPSEPGPGSSLWAGQPAEPAAYEPPAYQPPAPPPPAPMPPPAPGGMVSGDPLAPGSYPQGYTSPPPPGATGLPPAGPPGAAFSATPSPGTYVLSGWWRRVGAAVIDGLIIGVLALAIMAPLGIGWFSLDDSDTAGFFALVGAMIVAVLVIALVGLAYAPVMMGATNGKTLGRMATGIRVVRADGQRMTFGWAALREVAVKALLINGVAGSFTFGLAGLLDVLWPLWDDENRALHDFVVNTRTVID